MKQQIGAASAMDAAPQLVKKVRETFFDCAYPPGILKAFKMPLRPKALTYQVFLRRFIQFEAGLFSLRLGHGTALTSPRQVIHSRAAASRPLKLPCCSVFYIAI